MSNRLFFGYPPVPGAKFSWGARAIFHPTSTTNPLDILPDRQYCDLQGAPETDPDWVRFVDQVNTVCLPKMRSLALHFQLNDFTKFVCHFDWPHAPSGQLLVAQGSPNASCGYFYISVSLVDGGFAPAEVRPDIEEQNRRHATAAQLADAHRRKAESDAKWKAGAKGRREAKKHVITEFRKKLVGPFKKPGELLHVGDTLSVFVNQGHRDARVIHVHDLTALIEYQMTNGKIFLWEVHAVGHERIRTVNPQRLPKKWKEIEAQYV